VAREAAAHGGPRAEIDRSMIVPGYRVGEPLAQADPTLRRGRRDGDGRPVLVRFPPTAATVASAAAELRREHELLASLELAGVPRVLAFEPSSGALVMEDSGGAPLGALFAGERPALSVFFEIALGLCRTLGELHRLEIVHRNVHPGSVLVHPTTNRTELIDFSCAGRLHRESQSGVAQPIPARLAYASPEQTGRTNRAVDERSDLYSLGVVLYELLTGRPPFVSDDPLELVHGHLARTPRSPAELVPGLPAPVSDIVLKLLAKNAEQRYQSAFGLEQDLADCARDWAERGALAPRTLGERDVSDRFTIPRRLYGREKELGLLLEAFGEACAGAPGLLLIAGYSGIGKTSLVLEILRPVVERRGRFGSGKFDQLDRAVPYGALLQALRGLLEPLLAESEERLGPIRAELRDALGANAAVLGALLPELEVLLGPLAAVPQLGSTEAQNRLHFVLESFLAVFARPEHPLVLFLDDLQWADSATLVLLAQLLTSKEVRSLLLIGAYRDNEVGPGHLLSHSLAEIRAAGARVREIALAPLGAPYLEALIGDCLKLEAAEVAPLARLVLRKTDGNPFFVGQFLRALHAEGLIEFDHGSRRWVFDLARIERAELTDNVVDLLTKKLRRLSPSTQQALTLAACIGGTFSLSTLSVIRARPRRDVAAELWEAIAEGLIHPLGERYPLFAESAEAMFEDEAPTYRFLHDRVQQAAYACIPPSELRVVHLRVGRLLLAQHGPEVPDEQLFDVVNHLNVGHELLTDIVERESLVRLNLRAGRKAKESAAFGVASGHFDRGLELLAADAWSTHYELALALSMEAAEGHYLCGDFDEAEQRFETLLRRARAPLERAEAHRMRLVQFESMARYADALRAGRDGLELLGYRFPEGADERRAALEEERARIHVLLRERKIASLSELPTMTHAETRTVVSLLTAAWAPAYILGHDTLAFLFSAHIVRLSLERGNTEESAYGYVTHAISVGPVHGDYASAYEWGSLALRVNDRFQDKKLRAKVHQQFNAHVTLWRRPLESCIRHAREACKSGLESGDFNYAGYGALTETWAAWILCRDLERFVSDFTPTVALLERIRMRSLADAVQVFLAWARALQGRTEGPLVLSHPAFDEPAFDEAAYAAAHASNPFCLTFLHFARLNLALVFGDAEAARAALARIDAEAWLPAGTLWPVLLDFWGGLALAPALATASPERDAIERRLRASLATLAALAESCPETYRGPWLILSAEVERANGRPAKSLELLEQALRQVRASGNLLQEALASELGVRLWLALEREPVAAVYAQETLRCYSALGAEAKVRDLRTRYADLLFAAPTAARDGAPSLDVATVLKAAQAVARELEIERLTKSLVRIAVESAGAERGFLVREQDGRLVIVAEGTSAGDVRLCAELLEGRRDLSRGLVQLVHRTGESLIVDDAASDRRWVDEAYAEAVGPRSILCAPIVYQGRRSGILYLDNGLSQQVFSSARVEMLQILSAQAAIALENARLYGEMRQEVERRRTAEAALQEALTELSGLKDRLHAENAYLQEEIRTQHNFEEIVGQSPALLEALRKVEQVAATESTVLVLGETGAGKELFARAIHSRSARCDRPLVKVNCGAIPAGLVESELFGHLKGAFTGALQERTGRFELADGGTLFLDEVGELPLETQVKLLRVLQEHEFEPLGSSKTRRVDVRVIAATNRDLEAAVGEGRFRADLLYRLNVFPIRVPPLRERVGDVPLLVSFLLTGLSKKLGRTYTGFSRRSMERLMGYSWPGNVRELENIVQRAAIVSQGPVLELDGDPLREKPAEAAPEGGTLEELERTSILKALRSTRGIVEGPRGAAILLGLHPNTLRSRLKRLGIERRHYEIS
jgi:predicted ATPase/transcriptional regulator with GAF, ATPase, and Fis domain